MRTAHIPSHARAPIAREIRSVRSGALFSCALAATLVAPLPAMAQAWPTKAVRIIVPHPVGGPGDKIGRAHV